MPTSCICPADNRIYWIIAGTIGLDECRRSRHTSLQGEAVGAPSIDGVDAVSHDVTANRGPATAHRVRACYAIHRIAVHLGAPTTALVPGG